MSFGVQMTFEQIDRTVAEPDTSEHNCTIQQNSRGTKAAPRGIATEERKRFALNRL